jgi:hypothetical protein
MQGGVAMFSKLTLRYRFAIAAAFALATVPTTTVRAADGPPLKSYNAAIDESSPAMNSRRFTR